MPGDKLQMFSNPSDASAQRGFKSVKLIGQILMPIFPVTVY